MRDPYFGNRDWFTGEPTDTPEVWTDWDYALVSAFQVIEDNTNKHGLLQWEVDSERMDVKAIHKTDKFQAAVDRRTKGSKKKAYQPDPGEYFVPELDLRGGEWPTYSEYIKDMLEGQETSELG
jgi:hypothetical protein